MLQPKRVLCVMDLSLVGRAGLAVVLPILAACGVQASPLPTALFSAHTGGFGAVQKQDEADFCFAALAHFAREDIAFDAVYTGYLYGQAQFCLANAALAQYPNALHLVDPAMADDGKLYAGFEQSAVDGMASLCQKAHLITPNVTESALLLGEDPTATPTQGQLLQRLQKLSGGRRSVLITSAPREDGGFQIAGCGTDGTPFFVPSRHVPQRFPGTGDSLAAAVCGLVLGGMPLDQATRKAAAFVETAVGNTYTGGGTPRNGLWMEPLLGLLAPPGQTPADDGAPT